MNSLKVLMLGLTVALLSACSSTPLQHSYEGEVYLQSLQVNIDSLANGDDDAKGGSSIISEIQRVVQSIEDAFDEDKTELLVSQLNDFEDILIQGIRDASGVPLVANEPTSVNMTHGKHNEMTGITYEYERVKDDRLDLVANISYPSVSSTSIGLGFGGKEIMKVKPMLELQIMGKTKKGKPFWDQTVRHSSKKEYSFSNRYLFGVSTDRFEEGTIFLVPLAEGVVKQLKKDLK